MATPLARSKIPVAYLNSTTPYIHAKYFKISCKELKFAQFWLIFSTFEFTKPIKPYWTCEKFLDFLQGTEICAILAYFFKFGCHGNSLGSLENWDSLFEVDDPKIWLFMQKSSGFLAQNWNQCNFGLFLLKFGCHGNSLGSLKIMTAYWDSPVSKSQLYMRKISRFLAENWWVHFLPKFGCHRNSLSSLKNSDRVLKFTNPESPTLYAKKFSISCRKVMNAFFAQIWLPWQPPWLPWNFIYHIWIRRPRKPYYSCETVLDFLRRTEVSAFWLIFVQIWLPWQLLGLP